MRRPVALTGTPGTGKSSVARRLAPRWATAEVADLALRHGYARRTRSTVIVDLPRLVRWARRSTEFAGTDLVVGHLAHFLPVRASIVLRCRPTELARRLARARRGRRSDRDANFVAEATDGVLVEALETGRPVVEVDTTGRSVAEVAREIDRLVRAPLRPRVGRVDWLADRRVTAGLLARSP